MNKKMSGKTIRISLELPSFKQRYLAARKRKWANKYSEVHQEECTVRREGRSSRRRVPVFWMAKCSYAGAELDWTVKGS